MGSSLVGTGGGHSHHTRGRLFWGHFSRGDGNGGSKLEDLGSLPRTMRLGLVPFHFGSGQAWPRGEQRLGG